MTINDNSTQRSSFFIGLAIVVVVIISIVGIWFLKTRSSVNNGMRQITYQVDASGGYAQIIYTTSAGTNTEAQILTTQFNKTISVPIGTEVYLTASNPSQTGTIYCKIKLDGQDWKESHGTHPVDSVACAGIVK
jgi:hypothetical protein